MAGHSKWANIEHRKGAPDEKCGAGKAVADSCQEIRCEGYGPGGAAVVVQCRTDNRERTVSDLREVFIHHGGKLGAEDSVGYLFNPVGLLCFPSGSERDKVMQTALDAGAEDVIVNADGSLDVLTDPADYEQVRELMSKAGLVPANSEITLRASVAAALAGEQAESMLKMVEALEDLDDVQHVYSNADIPDEILARV